MTDKIATEPRETETPRGASRNANLAEVLAGLAEQKAEMHALRTLLIEQSETLRDLIAIVTAALPASLVRLSHASIAELIKEAPSTKLRLLAAYKTSFGEFAAGSEMAAGDTVIRQHYRSMSLGIAPQQSDAPAKAVAAIIERQAAEIAAHNRNNEQARLAREAATARAEADKREAAAAAATRS